MGLEAGFTCGPEVRSNTFCAGETKRRASLRELSGFCLFEDWVSRRDSLGMVTSAAHALGRSAEDDGGAAAMMDGAPLSGPCCLPQGRQGGPTSGSRSISLSNRARQSRRDHAGRSVRIGLHPPRVAPLSPRGPIDRPARARRRASRFPRSTCRARRLLAGDCQHSDVLGPF